ncbi:sterol desaturase family protein [Desulfobulbus sp. AH-315-M07]|nr:sterol desaturase family protein [Desulfobulbus sp. AH-315-M07]
MDWITYAIPVFVVAMIAECVALSRSKAETLIGYSVKDTAASLSMGLGYFAIGLGIKIYTFGFLVWLYQFRFFDLPNTWWVWALLIPAEDFIYYVYHRAHHEVRFFWAAHVNHHSSRHYNLSTALRQSYTTPFTGVLFWAPLPLLGFAPEMILGAKVISLLYQFLLHTELVRKLGPLEWILNTPSHHRVHHGRNSEYLDKNYGGIFIIYDRLFGTFEAEHAPVDFGLTKQLRTFNPLRIAFHEWAAMFRDAATACCWRVSLARIFRGPAYDGACGRDHSLRRSQSNATVLKASAR